MRNLATWFRDELTADVTTLTFCWRLTLRDGRVMGFTSHDRPLTIEGVTYEAESGLLPSAFASSISSKADDVECSALFDSQQVTEQDLLSGALDGAEYLYFLASWMHLPTSLSADPAQCLLLSAGRLGAYSSDENGFKAEALSLIDKLAEKQTIQTSPVCRANLGDSKCKVNLAPFTHELTVVSATANTITTSALDKPDGWFKHGTLEFLDGANAGAQVKIADWDNSANKLTLYIPLFYPVEAGDHIRVVAGCNKTFNTCKQKFDNSINFRGEPYLASADTLFSGVPSARTADTLEGI